MKAINIVFLLLVSTFSASYAVGSDCVINATVDDLLDKAVISIQPSLVDTAGAAVQKWAENCSACGGTWTIEAINAQCIQLSCLNVSSESMSLVAQRAKEREQSLQNRLFSGVAIGLTGFGGMELASGLAEQKVDQQTENDMAAYMSTFRCEYGPNKIDGGVMGNELSGANKLLELYQEYQQLALNLQEAKAMLNMTPGIESQVVLDASNVGLYDDISMGNVNGTFASLYRASIGNQSDIDKLAEQKQQTSNKIVTGVILSLAGIAVGVLGSILDRTLEDNVLDEDAVYNANDKCVNNCPSSVDSDIIDGIKNMKVYAGISFDDEKEY